MILQIVLCIIAIICILVLRSFQVGYVATFIISLIFLLVCNLIWVYILQAIHRKTLDEDCDPVKYLKMMDRQEKRLRKNSRVVNYLTINRAVGHMLLGDFQTAIVYLKGIDPSSLSEKDGTYLVYTLDMILCHYELGETDQAEALYETNMVRLSPFSKRLRKSVEILIGERYFFLKEYSLSYEYLKKLLNYDLTKRQYLSVLYRLAQMDVINGATEQAITKLNKIAKHGNKLWIAKDSREMLDKIKVHNSESPIFNSKDKMI